MVPKGVDVTEFKRRYRTRSEGDFPQELVLRLRKEWDLKYGENPNQQGAIYVLAGVAEYNTSRIAELTNIQSVRADGKGKGGLSLNNMLDITRAMDNLKWFSQPAVVIQKHTIDAGVAVQRDLTQTQRDLFRLARDADRRSTFGGTAAFNRPLTKETAETLYERYAPRESGHWFVDVIAAPGYEEGVVWYIQSKASDVRIAEFSHLEALPRFQGDDTKGLISIKEMPGGRVGIQDLYLTSIIGAGDFLDHPYVTREGGRIKVERAPTASEKEDLLMAWYLNISCARSNGVVFVRDGVTVAIGSGQVERGGAVEQAIVKGMQKAMDREGIIYDPLMGIAGYEQLKNQPFQGAVCSSDGFFPFDDSLKLLVRVGVTAAVQPFGSQNDDVVIKGANLYKVAMVATGERCFGHF